jgi:indole-3-acetate monooxygenase
MTPTAETNHSPEVQVLRQQLEEISDRLEASALESEQLGRLAPDAEAALRSTDLFRLWWPGEFGGPGATISDGIGVIEAATEVDTAAAWNLAVCTIGSGFAAAYLSDEAVKEVFSEPLTLIAGQTAPKGIAEVTDRGLVVSGQWTFGSGIHLASWAKAGVMINGPDGPSPALVVVPIDDVTIDHDSWEVAGLAGSGSCDYSMDNVHVPSGYWYDYPQPTRRRGCVTFELPLPAQVVILHAGFALGVARRALAEITSLATIKVRQNDTGTVSSRPRFQFELSEHHSRLAGARLHVYDCAERLQATAGSLDFGLPMHELRAATRYANDIALDIATWAYRSGGGATVKLTHPLQRLLRDMLAATQHVYVDDRAHNDFGAALLGLEAAPRAQL